MELKKGTTQSLSKGFSLIELTIVIGLIALLTLAISAIMLTSIGTSNRIRTTTRVKQAGSFVIDQLQSILRSAKSVTICDNTLYTITVVNPDGSSSTIRSTGGRIASDAVDYISPENMTVSGFSLACEPSITDPNLVKVKFDLKSSQITRASENPNLHFETSINLRNE